MREIFSFSYAQSWLDHLHAKALDPDLQLYTGAQYLGGDKPNFGLVLDSSPGRWGRVLMERREAVIAKTEGRKSRKLFEEKPRWGGGLFSHVVVMTGSQQRIIFPN